MSKSGKFGYIVGYAAGMIMVYGLYIFAIVMILWDLWNRQVPVTPLILLFTVMTWRKIVQIYTVFQINAQINEYKNILLSQINQESEIDRMMSKISQKKYGGPN